MKILDPVLTEALNQNTLTIAWCWLIARVDGLQLGFTSLDVPFTIDGVTYQPYTGFDPGAAQTSADLSKVDSQQLKGILDASGISKEDLASGIYEYAKVRRFLVNYQDLPTSLSLDPSKHLELPQGYLAESTRNALGYEIKVKDDLNLLDAQIGTSTSKTCRANLGDDRCRVDLAPFTHNLTVTAVENKRIFDVNGNLPDKYFDFGRILFTSNANDGIWRDIGFYLQGKIILSPSPAPFEVQVGDTVTAIAGCAKTKLACITRFQNFQNFLGEPDVPTTDLSIETPVNS